MPYRALQRFYVDEIQIAFFKNKLIHDIIAIILDYDSNKGLPGYALDDDSVMIYGNIDYLKYFTIISHIVNSAPDHNYKLLIEFYNIDDASYNDSLESLSTYLMKSCRIYFKIKKEDESLLEKIDAVINSILVEIYN